MRILIAGKEADMLNRLKNNLEAVGHTVLTVQSMGQVVNLVRANYSIDGIITEQALTGHQGTDLIAQVNYRTPAYVLGPHNPVGAFIMKWCCFPNIVFVPRPQTPEEQWAGIKNWLTTIEKKKVHQLKHA